jgi:hypothetical protein
VRERGSDFFQKYIRPVWLVRSPCALGKEAFATARAHVADQLPLWRMHLRTAHQAWVTSLERIAASHQGRIYKPSQVCHKTFESSRFYRCLAVHPSKGFTVAQFGPTYLPVPGIRVSRTPPRLDNARGDPLHG